MTTVPEDLMAAVEVAYPDIALRIRSTWGDPLCTEYMRRLLIIERSDYRGFEPVVFAALAELLEMHLMHFPVPAPDVWGNAL